MRQRGFALVIVLWAMVALTLGAAILTADGRRSINEAAATGDAAKAAAALDSAAQQAIFHLLAEGQQHWSPEGTRMIDLGDAVVSVAIANQAGAVNPNTASPTLLAGLFVVLGRTGSEAAALAENIVEWRTEASQPQQKDGAGLRYRAAGLGYAPPFAPFRSLGELGLVLGMTPDLLARVRPYLSLWSNAEPDPAFAAPPVRAAMRNLPNETGLIVADGPAVLVVALTCRVVGGPARAARRLVVRLQPTEARPFQIVESAALEE